MRGKICWILLAAVLSFGGCGPAQNAQETARQKLNQPFQTTARVSYKGLETVMTLYKKPMNCAVVTFEAPESLQDMELTFYTDRVTVAYKELHFDFVPESLSGKAASKMVISAVNAALSDKGVSVRQEENRLIISGKIEEGDFTLTIDAENGSILKLSIPQSELELEVLNFKILE